MAMPAEKLDVFDDDFEEEFERAEHEAYVAQAGQEGSVALTQSGVGVPPVAVEDTERANRSLRAIKYWRGEMEALEAQFGAEIERLQMRLGAERVRLEKRIRWHEVGLFHYYAALGKKTVRLAYGKLSSAAGRERVEIDKEGVDAFLVWAKANAPGLIRTKEEPDKTAIKGYIKETGEEPVGCSLEVGEDIFKVDVD